jgi:hypothetical protein
MKSFHKDYTLAELKIIIKAWNKHFRIYTTGKKKKQLADELDKYFEHNKDGEIEVREEADIVLDLSSPLRAEKAKKKEMKEKNKSSREQKKRESEEAKAPAPVQRQKSKSEEAKAPTPVQRQKSKSEEAKAPAPVQRQESLTKEEIAERRRERLMLALLSEKEIEKYKKEKSRIQSYSNTDATAALPNEMLRLIYRFLPQDVRDTAEQGTQEEQDTKFFRTRFPATREAAEDIHYKFHDKFESYQEATTGRAQNIVDEKTEGMSARRKYRLLDQIMDEASDQATEDNIETILRFLKKGKTVQEILDDGEGLFY